MKDTKNLLDYNVWSAGDYLTTMDGFSGGNEAIVQLSNEFSINGEYSIKTIRKSPLYGTTLFTRLSNLTGTNTINATVKVYSPNNHVKVNLYNGSILTEVTCPASSTVQNISLTTTVTSSYVDLRFFLDNVDDFIFVDDISIIVI